MASSPVTSDKGEACLPMANFHGVGSVTAAKKRALQGNRTEGPISGIPTAAFRPFWFLVLRDRART